MREYAGQRASEKLVGSLVVAAEHSGVQRRANFVAFDFTERQYGAIRTICKPERAPFIIKVRYWLHPAFSAELYDDQVREGVRNGDVTLVAPIDLDARALKDCAELALHFQKGFFGVGAVETKNDGEGFWGGVRQGDDAERDKSQRCDNRAH